MLESGSQLGHYKLIGKLGAGGMGDVYRAKDLSLGREVAIKVLPEPLTRDAVALSRFAREARALAAISHPNILTLFDFSADHEGSFAVTELLEGETLRERMNRGLLPWRQALDIAISIATGLAAAHAKGIIHRDLKPENIFITTAGVVKILDFGLAFITAERIDETPSLMTLRAQKSVDEHEVKTLSALPSLSQSDNQSAAPTAISEDLHVDTTPDIDAGLLESSGITTLPGTIMGTPNYMSPEQVRAKPVDTRSDVFSFGCVLYEMLTGSPPFQRLKVIETMRAVANEEAEPIAVPDLPGGLSALIARCLAKRPDDRCYCAQELLDELHKVVKEIIRPLPAPIKVQPGNEDAIAERPVLLMLANITGYARFMLANREDAIHAQILISELMRAVIDHVAAPLAVSKVDGDAFLLYAVKESGPWPDEAKAGLGRILLELRNAFAEKLKELTDTNICRCICCKSVALLKLKLVVHSGHALIHSFGSFPQLSGVDLIIAHNLLRETPYQEIVLTEAAVNDLMLPPTLSVTAQQAESELGLIRTYVCQPPAHSSLENYRTLGRKLVIELKKLGTTLLHFLGLRRRKYYYLPKK